MAPLLSGTLLVVDQDRGPRDLPQVALRRIQGLAVPHLSVARQLGPAILRGIFRHHDGPAHSFCFQLAGKLGNRQRARGILPAGHGHRSIVQNFVGDVDAGGHGGADRHAAGVEESAVADVLEHVRHLGEGRHADPLRPFTTHLGDAMGVALHAERHGVAADPCRCERPLGNDGGTIVRATTAEIGRSR